ncbi:MAG: M20/M25/M40 family metallo-hydrolase [Anaerolineae bacterium]
MGRGGEPLPNRLRDLAARYQPAMVRFCQRLVQTPSLSGQEGAVVDLVAQEMETLGFDEVYVDPVGNVVGRMQGEGGPSLMFNCHVDHVAPGDESRWPFPPYAGALHEGYLWGVGASDTKGALAPQVYALGALRQAGASLPGDVYVVGVVQEEVNGLGTRNLLQRLRPDAVILGEATANQIARGHRGRGEVVVRIWGRAAHASAPERGVNPHQVAARFVLALERLPLPTHPDLGASSLTPTLYRTDQVSGNVIPGEVELHLDWRVVPGTDVEAFLARLQALADACLTPGSRAEVGLLQRHLRSYKGHEQTIAALTMPFLLPEDHALVRGSRAILSQALGREVRVGLWRFTTDGGHFMGAGIPTIGFSPCEEHLAHTAEDRVSVALMEEGMVGYMALALHLGPSLQAG